MQYQAFLSYSHAVDSKLGAVLQSALQRFAKPWYRLRNLRVFRDKTGLSVSPGLWPEIEAALATSEYFILLAAPEAAASEWVGREVQWWCANRSADKLLIVLTSGELTWGDGDFDWTRTTALPGGLMNVIRQEPMYLDLRWARSIGDLSLRNPRFREAVAELAAPLHGRSKDALIGEDIRQHRRTLRLAWSVGVGLVLLTVTSAAAGWTAVQQRNRATHARSESEKLIQFMLFDLRDKLEPIGRLDLLEDVNRRTREYYQAFPVEQDEPPMKYQRAVALASSADYLRRRGDSAAALRPADDGWRIIRQLVDASPRDAQARRHLAIATTERARVYQDLGDLARAERDMREAVGTLETLTNSDKDEGVLSDLAFARLELGSLLKERKNLEGLRQFESALAIYRDLASRRGDAPQWHQRSADALNALGSMLQDVGRLKDALRAYTESGDIVQRLLDLEPANMLRRHDLALAHGALAGVLLDQGEVARAERELRTKRQMTEALTTHDPANAIWQQELADTDGRLGTLLGRLDRTSDAVSAHRRAITLLELLVAQNPGNRQSRHALAESHRALGDTQFGAGQFESGLRVYQENLKLMIELARQYPDDPEMQRAKAIAFANAAGIYADGLQDRPAALALYRDAVATFTQLTNEYPANVVAQADLAGAHEKLGRFHAGAGEFDEGVAEFEAGLAIMERLVAGEATNVAWQGDLIRLQHATGSALLAKADLSGAADVFARALARSRTLAREHPDEVSWHSLAAVSHERIGALHRRGGDRQAAAASYREAMASLQEVARLAPDSPEAQQNLATMRALLAQVDGAVR